MQLSCKCATTYHLACCIALGILLCHLATPSSAPCSGLATTATWLQNIYDAAWYREEEHLTLQGSQGTVPAMLHGKASHI